MDKFMQSKEDVIEIDLRELVGLLLHWLWLLVLCGAVAGITGFLICKLTVTPWYESTTRIFILNKNRNNESALSYSDLQTSNQLTKNYTPFIKSRDVLEKVIKLCDLSETYESFASRVKVATVGDSNLIAITVTDSDPNMAQRLAKEVQLEAADHIVAVMGIEAANVETEANLPENPSGPSASKWALIGGFLGVFTCAAILIIQYLLDDTIKSAEDVERYLGLSTLAMIPIAEQSDKHKKNKGRSRERFDSEMVKAVNEANRNVDLVVQEINYDNE